MFREDASKVKERYLANVSLKRTLNLDAPLVQMAETLPM